MARFNPDFWEIPTDVTTLDRVPATQGLYYETEDDQARRHALTEFFQEVSPAVQELIETHLTRRQREIVKLYYFYGKTQEDIAIILDLTQSTVSRHLYGTVRDGKKVGGAIPKLRKVIDRTADPAIARALGALQQRLTQAA